MPGLWHHVVYVVIAVDFDNTVVRADHAYSDTASPLQFMPGAREGLHALKAAGHQLILWSGRANLALRENPELDPLVRAGARVVHKRQWLREAPLNVARYEQMLAFVARELPGIFDGIDDGTCGKVTADVYLDDRAITFGHRLGGVNWADVSASYGEQQAFEPSVFKEQR